ncbi:DNA polymerase III subunit beta [Candidatus Parcubacteria bacterium]|nr:MAG: DNA polymerase III subunit beta [Candidatus Parcubacteria bacterium]
MKFTSTLEHLKNAVQTVERFSGRHITLPILAHILIVVKERGIALRATNLEMGIEYTIPGKTLKVGATTVPARSFSQILQSLRDDTVTLEAEKQHLAITTQNTNATLFGLNADEFPVLPAIKEETKFSLDTILFTGALERIIPAAATSDLKPQLNGVYLAVKPGTITLAATDSFRLAEQTLAVPEIKDTSVECILPLRTAQELLHTLPAEGTLAIGIGEHQIVFRAGNVEIVSRLIDGAYPPYRAIIPKTYETNTVIKRDDLIQRIRLAAIFSSRLNEVSLEVGPQEIAVATSNSETGSSTTRLAAKGKGKTGSVLFNHRYLVDGLAAAGGEHVTLNLNGSGGAALIQNPNDSSFLYLLMPIRSA